MRKDTIQKLIRPLGKFPPYKWAYWYNVKRLVPKLLDKPIRVIVENTNYCNLDCYFCPNQIMKRKKGFMSMTMFEDIVDQCVIGGIDHLYHFGIGEPLLDKSYYDKMDYAFDKIKDIHCVTNGVLLKRPIFCNYLGISVDATLGMKEEKEVFENIKKLWPQYKFFYPHNRPFIELRFKEYGDYSKYKPYCDKIGVYINVTNWGNEVGSNCSGGVQFPCSDLWSSMYICWDGRVALCCKDYECSMMIGDLNKESLLNIWKKSYILRNMRYLHLSNIYSNICKGCVSNTHLVNPWWRIEL